MTQMYRVKFTRNANHAVDAGEAVLNADSQDQAITLAAQMLSLPTTGTQFEVARVKPPFVLIRRNDVDRRMATYDADTVHENLATRATFPHDKELPEREIFAVAVVAELRAEGEVDALQSTARAISRHALGERQKPSMRNLEVSCELVLLDRTTTYERNANYTSHRFVRGGAMRPR